MLYFSGCKLKQRGRVSQERSTVRHADKELDAKKNEYHKDVGKFYAEKRYQEYIIRWKNGLENGMRGKTAISVYIKKYLFEKFNKKCNRCDWCKINPTTNRIPLEIEHLDGDFTNNKEENLELICPNCHSLTSTYRSLNKGKGRPR